MWKKSRGRWRPEKNFNLFRLSSWLTISFKNINKPQGSYGETCVSLVTEFQVSNSFLQVIVLFSLVQQLISVSLALNPLKRICNFVGLLCTEETFFFPEPSLFKVVKFPEYLYKSFLQGCYEAPDINSIFRYSRRPSSIVYMIIFVLFLETLRDECEILKICSL